MDMKVAKKKLGLKERYALMTRGLDWETTQGDCISHRSKFMHR